MMEIAIANWLGDLDLRDWSFRGGSAAAAFLDVGDI